MLKAASKTLRLPTVDKSPRLKVPWWPEIIKLPKPTAVVNAAKRTPLAVPAGKVMTRTDFSCCQRTRMIIPYSTASPRINGKKSTLA